MKSLWNDRRSILLSRMLVWLFAAALALLDIGGWWLFRWLTSAVLENASHADFLTLTATLYACSIPGWLLLAAMDRLLKHLMAGEVFTERNVSLMRTVSLCCFAAGIICLVGAVQIFSLFFITLAALFVGLIVRIVKNAFEQAIRMKDELDYTI